MSGTDPTDGIQGRRVRPGKGHESIRREALQDTTISFKALGILTYLLSLPDTWKTNSERLGMTRSGKEGRDAVRTGLKELEAAGYLHRERVHVGGGKWRWVWSYTDDPSALLSDLEPDSTVVGFPNDAFPTGGNPCGGKSGDIEVLEVEVLEVDKNNPSSVTPDGVPDEQIDDHGLFSEEPGLSEAVVADQPSTDNQLRSTVVRRNPSAGLSGKSAPDDLDRIDVEQLCTRLRDRVIENGCKPPKITSAWRTSARLLLDTDHRPLQEALWMIDWCQRDEFWRPNVLSMPKFRDQYDQLVLKAKAEVKRNRSGGSGPGDRRGGRRVDVAALPEEDWRRFSEQ